MIKCKELLSKKILLLLCIILNTFIIRLFHVMEIPPFIDSSLQNERIISVIISSFSVVLVFILISGINNNYKVALVTSWIYSVMPWTIEQGRIISQPARALFLFLIFLIIYRKISNTLRKAIFFSVFLAIFKIIYPEFWMFNVNNFGINYLQDSLRNIFTVFSINFWFFKNNSFYLGGVKNWGILSVGYLPFIFYGVAETIRRKKTKVLFMLIIIGILASFSPKYPETREFYLSVPFIIYTSAVGFIKFVNNNNFKLKLIGLILILFILYDISQYLHYYFNHFPLDLNPILPDIHSKY